MYRSYLRKSISEAVSHAIVKLLFSYDIELNAGTMGKASIALTIGSPIIS